MQRPTLQNVRIGSTKDALHVFHAVARNVLPLIIRRLDAEERRAIRPGNVYVWEERAGGNDDEASVLGMERWTDGIAWGPSRVRDEFLFYQQKEDVLPDPTSPSAIWDQSRKRKDQLPTSTSRRLKDPLMKQTYSVYVSFPSDRQHGIVRKWHLTAYFSQQKLDDLYTVDCIPGIGNVPIPEGWFKSARSRKPRRNTNDSLLSASRQLDHSPPSIERHLTASMSPPSRYASVEMYCHRRGSIDEYTYPLSPTSPTMSTASGPSTTTRSSHSSNSPPAMVTGRRISFSSPTMTTSTRPHTPSRSSPGDPSSLLAPIHELQQSQQRLSSHPTYSKRDPRDEAALKKLRNTLLR